MTDPRPKSRRARRAVPQDHTMLVVALTHTEMERLRRYAERINTRSPVAAAELIMSALAREES